MTLKEQILKRAEFDELEDEHHRWATDVAYRTLNTVTEEYKKQLPKIGKAPWVAGGLAQHARLRPLIEALAECVDAVERVDLERAFMAAAIIKIKIDEL